MILIMQCHLRTSFSVNYNQISVILQDADLIEYFYTDKLP